MIEMCVTIMLPVIIISSIAKIITSEGSRKFIFKIFVSLFLTFIIVSAVSIISSFLVSPITAPNFETTKNIGRLMIIGEEKEKDNPNKESKYALEGYYFIREIDTEKEDVKNSFNLMGYIIDFFPDNIFNALANGKTVKILIFSIIFGLLFKFMPSETSRMLIHFCDTIFEAFNTMLVFLIYLLPFGIISIISKETVGLNFHILFSLVKLAELIALVFLIIFIISILIIKHTSRKPLGEILKALQEPMILSFVAENLIAIPSLINAMTDKLGFDRNRVGLTVPLWMGMEIHADIAVFAAASIFTFQLYGIHIGFTEILFILIGAAVAGMSAMAAAAVVWVGLIKIVLDPLNIPSSPIIFALMIFEPFFNNLLFLLNSVISAAAVSILSREKKVEVRVQKLEDKR
jgi:Na+/H+-dicarboxylate symporter